MKCSKCGQECPDNMSFCTNCGTELNASVQSEPVAEKAEEVPAQATVAEEVTQKPEETKEPVEKKKSFDLGNLVASLGKTKLMVIGGACVALLLLVVIVAAVALSGGASYEKYTDKTIIDVAESEGDYYVCYLNGDRVKLDEEPYGGYKENMDGTVLAYKNDDNELVIFAKGKEIKTGIDEVSNIAVSNYGDTVVYFTDCETVEFKVPYYYDEWWEEYYYNTYSVSVGTLNLYDVNKKKNTEIAEEVCVDSAVLSPNGKTVAYIADYEVNDDGETEFKGYYSVNGKDPEELGKEKRIFAISDKAKYIYYSDAGRLYVHVKKDDVKLANEVSYVNVMLNKDYSEMMFTSEGKTYVTVKGGEKQKVSGSALSSIMLNEDAAGAYYSVSTQEGSIYVTNVGVDTLKENLFYSSNEYQVVYVMKNFETEKIASDVYRSDCVLSDDGKSMVYLDGDNVMKVTKFAKGGEKEKIEKISDADEIFANGKLDMIYVLDTKGDLHFVKKDKDVDVAEDVTEATFSGDGKYFYYVEDNDTLFYTTNGKKTKKIASAKGDELDVVNYCGNVFVGDYDDDEVTLYRLKGKKMKELYTIED